MAQAVEEKILSLEEAARRQEEFTANFAHELKTPLTSIIGYADMLRSSPLSQEEQLVCANYIFGEGKRLEALSFKLLDLFVCAAATFQKGEWKRSGCYSPSATFFARQVSRRALSSAPRHRKLRYTQSRIWSRHCFSI